MSTLWIQLAADADLMLSQPQIDLLNRYLDLLLEANQTMNLTRITDRAAAEVLHVGDALTLLKWLPSRLAGKIEPRVRKTGMADEGVGPTLADVGSGGGIPGIPLAIVRPDLRVTLIESVGKKTAFLERTVATLGLSDVRVLRARAEDLGKISTERFDLFDVVVARAVASLDELIPWCAPLLKPGGRLLAMKGPKATAELAAAAKAVARFGLNRPMVHEVRLPGAQGHVVVELRRGGR